jgi:hypothetical protein
MSEPRSGLHPTARAAHCGGGAAPPARARKPRARLVTQGGPCGHCACVESPCWRKGPPEKPILCNACGARFLVKGNLDG